MRNGILFFMNMDKVRTIARWALLPVFFIIFTVRFGSPVFFVCIGVFVLSAFLSFLPTPTEKDLQRVLTDFQTKLKEQTLLAAVAKNKDLMIIMNGYQMRGKMFFKKQVGKDVIYPHLASLALYRKENTCTLVLGTKSLFSVAPAVYTKIKLSPSTLSFPTDTEHEGVVMLTLTAPELSETLTLFVKNDYHYRDFMTAVKPFLN
ncbi:MAG: hypothetical protein IJW49_01340 [Clostridia bacterium]|nr:hypothetical protein [Clostridia bacterium]